MWKSSGEGSGLPSNDGDGALPRFCGEGSAGGEVEVCVDVMDLVVHLAFVPRRTIRALRHSSLRNLRLAPAGADPGDVNVVIEPQAQAHLGGVALRVVGVVDVQLGTTERPAGEAAGG